MQLGRNTPGNGIPLPLILTPVVKNLPNALSVVTVLFEPLRQGHGLRADGTEMRWQIPNAKRVGAHTRQRRSTGRIAYRLLAIGMLKEHPLRCQPIQIR